MKKNITLIFALLVLATSLLMAGSAAWQRSATVFDGALLVAMSCVGVAAVHLLPSLFRSPKIWFLWVVCFLLSLYGHAGFFAFASKKSSEEWGQTSKQTELLHEETRVINETLKTIKARPITTVSTDLANAKSEISRNRLQIELDEAKRAAGLRNDLLRLHEQQVGNVNVVDPFVSQVALVTGVTDQKIALFLNLAMAVCLELIGAVLWCEFFKKADVPKVTASPKVKAREPLLEAEQPEEKDSKVSEDESLDRLHKAVVDRKCALNVRSIRAFLNCSHQNALVLRRKLSLRLHKTFANSPYD